MLLLENQLFRHIERDKLTPPDDGAFAVPHKVGSLSGQHASSTVPTAKHAAVSGQHPPAQQASAKQHPPLRQEDVPGLEHDPIGNGATVPESWATVQKEKKKLAKRICTNEGVMASPISRPEICCYSCG